MENWSRKEMVEFGQEQSLEKKKKKKTEKEKWRVDTGGYDKEIKHVVDVTFGQNYKSQN